LIVNDQFFQLIGKGIFGSYFNTESVNVIIKSSGLDIEFWSFPANIIQESSGFSAGIGLNVIRKEE
jgi:hypothetical protein